MGSYFDERLNFGEAVDVGATAVGDAALTDTINLGAVSPGTLEHGTEIPVCIQVVTENFAGVGATVQFICEADDDSAFGSTVETWSSGEIPVATLVIGYRVPRPILANAGLQYVRLIIRVGTANLTAGMVTAWVEAGRQAN